MSTKIEVEISVTELCDMHAAVCRLLHQATNKLCRYGSPVWVDVPPDSLEQSSWAVVGGTYADTEHRLSPVEVPVLCEDGTSVRVSLRCVRARLPGERLPEWIRERMRAAIPLPELSDMI